MNNGLIAICDEDSDYANSLAAYFRLKGSLASEIVVFTKWDNFSRFSKEHNIDILIMQEDFTDSITSLSYNNLFILCDNSPREDLDDSHKIYKYNSAEEILRIIMANYDTSQPTSLLSFHKYRKSKLIGIASPIGRCGKTSLGLGLALKYTFENLPARKRIYSFFSSRHYLLLSSKYGYFRQSNSILFSNFSGYGLYPSFGSIGYIF